MLNRNLLLIATFIPQLCFAQLPECTSLSSPVSYYNKQSKSYLLAVDECMVNLFSELGLTIRKKPKPKRYINLVDSISGFPNNAFYYSEKLKMNFEASSEDNVYSSIVAALSFKVGRSTVEGYTSSDRNLVREVQVCCGTSAHQYISCAKAELSDYYSGRTSFTQCSDVSIK